MSTLSKRAAKALIAGLRLDNGVISEEDRANTPPDVLRALASIRRKLGSATKALATNLYSKDTRFLYELIQNAEDNDYSQAHLRGEDPYLSFDLYPDRIVLESNENGFCDEHVKAICSTGSSTKRVAGGYIGEKGIGFKSVFKVAKKVIIQSGPFSFSFEFTRGHNDDDDGIGMITPLDEEFVELPKYVNTRITLMLLEPSTFQQRADDILSIPDTLLLFLTKLNKLNIKIHPQDGDVTEIEYSHLYGDNNSLESIKKKTRVSSGPSTCNELHFHVTRREAKDLPSDKARRHTNQATVVLAFPIDNTSNSAKPVLEQQHVFAFLPLHRAGFKFLIQSDFIVKADREGALHLERNKQLLLHVAKTFRDAVLEFCSHPSLQYTWMRYLPDNSISDEFWEALGPEIISLLRDTHCLRPWSESSLCLPSQLCRLRSNFKDRTGQPLFDDSAEESYLSQNYIFEDFKRLIPIGTNEISDQLMIKRIKEDLKEVNSKMKASTPDEDWHKRTAELLSEILQKKNNSMNNQSIRSLPLIPLQDGEWVSKGTRTIYFPCELNCPDAIPIPTDLDLDLVHLATITNKARVSLFVRLGVVEASPEYIIEEINDKYDNIDSCDMALNISHLRYLFWNFPKKTTHLNENIFLMNQDGLPVSRISSQREYLYIEERKREYGTKQLLQKAPAENPTAPGLYVHFLDAEYLDAFPAGVTRHGRSWRQWLINVVGVPFYPQLKHPTKAKLSEEFKYIIKHRPEKLVGLLQKYWKRYEPDLTTKMVEKLKGCVMPCSKGIEREYKLQETFLPLPKLKKIVEKSNIEAFPFLDLPEELTEENQASWSFLKRFGVMPIDGSDDLSFYLELLRRILMENVCGCTSDSLDSLFEAYGGVERNCSSSEDTENVREFFLTNNVIYIPWADSFGSEWVESASCVWTAPAWLESKKRLDGILKYSEHHHLFRDILKIPNPDWRDYFQDLESLKENDLGNVGRAGDIYHHIWREFEHDTNWDSIRELLENSELVFLPTQEQWYPLSACVWAEDKVQIPKKVSIKTHYPNLEEFFCKVLGVPTPNLEMYVQALKELARTQPPPPAAELKRNLLQISSMNPTSDDVKSLQRANIFSVVTTTGQTSRTNSLADFAINDRMEYGSAFTGKLRILDFTIQEVRACRSLFYALDLKRKYLSELVDEKTRVEDAAFHTGLTESFRLRANALYRCMVHYQSLKASEDDLTVYNQLLRASVYVSNGIYKSISVVQYRETITIQKSRAKFHLEEKDGELKLYVPLHKVAREECFYRQLPRRLMEYLGILDLGAESTLCSIIGCKSLINVENILEDAGIAEVEGAPLDLDLISRDYPQPQNQDGDSEHQTSESGRSTPDSTTTHDDSSSRKPHHPGGILSASGYKEPPLSFPTAFVPPSATNSTFSGFSSESSTSDTGYSDLLGLLIESAKNMTIPEAGSSAFNDLYDPTNELPASVFGTRSKERNMKVGAAGELLAFEILLNADLPKFDRDNWRSTIRGAVHVHEKYDGLKPWGWKETTDIVYADKDGVLTKLLIKKNYLQKDIWKGQKPTYYLEVKSTTRDCDERFYMSGAQHSRMKKLTLDPKVATSEVYVILRVFNLEGKVGLRVFVDPVSTWKKRDLKFKVATWAVKCI